MFIKNWKKEILTIPNLLSLFRMVLIPAYMVIYLGATERPQFFAAGIILSVSCLTDALDGWVARRFNMISTVGKILDPLADKMTQFTLTLCLSLKYPALVPVLALFIVKEFFQVVVGIINLRRGKILPGALMAGKVCTAVLFVSLTAMVIMPTMDPRVVDIIAFTDGLFLIVSLVSYGFAYMGKSGTMQDL